MSTGVLKRTHERWVWGAVVAVMAAVLALFAVRALRVPAVRYAVSAPLDLALPLPAFELVDQDGRPFASSALRGRPWVADFVFTRCAGPCPLMTAHMKRLQDDLTDVPEVSFVSISVDPDYDRPAVLAAYAQAHGADPQRWRFLTGTMEQIYDLAIDGFKVAVEQARQDQQIIHDSRFILVDGEGRIRGYYDSGRPEELDALRRDARRLAGG